MHRYPWTYGYWWRNWRANLRYFLFGDRVTYRGELSATLIRKDGSRKDLGVISRRVVTTAGVNYMRDDFNGNAGGADITLLNFHDSGTGVAAEAITDVDLGTPAGPTTRATGTQSAPASKQYRTVGTITFSGTLSKTTQRALDGGLSFLGTLQKETRRALDGSVGFAGALTKLTLKGLNGDLSFLGELSKLVSRSLSGTLSFVGDLSASHLFFKALEGALSFSSAIVGVVQAFTGTVGDYILLRKRRRSK